VADVDHPGTAGRRVAVDPQVAAEVGARARRPPRQQPADQQVGRQPLADPAGVEADARRQGDGGAGLVDRDPPPAEAER
jgi:hypothetical protein